VESDFNDMLGAMLVRLSPDEGSDWSKLWQKVESLRQRAAGTSDKPAAIDP
jgi:hypothetical protein